MISTLSNIQDLVKDWDKPLQIQLYLFVVEVCHINLNYYALAIQFVVEISNDKTNILPTSNFNNSAQCVNFK